MQTFELRTFKPSCREAGFTYIGLLLVVALFGVVLATVGEVWHTTRQRERERDLLFVGDEFRKAIVAYYEGTPGEGAKQFPKTFEELLLDRRYPAVRRYLRKIYADPMTGKPDWGLIKGPGDTIMGVYSQSTETPVKRANFPLEYDNFSVAKSYVDWKFGYSQSAVAPVASAMAEQTGKSGTSTRGGLTRPLIPTASVLKPMVQPTQTQPAQSLPLSPVAPGQTQPAISVNQRADGVPGSP